jgi:hypothetical protein
MKYYDSTICFLWVDQGRWRQKVPPKCWHQIQKVHDAPNNEAINFICYICYGYSCNTSDLNSGDASFDFCPEHRLPWSRFFRFLSVLPTKCRIASKFSTTFSFYIVSSSLFINHITRRYSVYSVRLMNHKLINKFISVITFRLVYNSPTLHCLCLRVDDKN